MNKQRWMLLGGFIGLILVITAAWMVSKDKTAPTKATPNKGSVQWAVDPVPWALADDRQAVGIVATSDGPAIYVSPKDQLLLAPKWPGLTMTWTHEDQEDRVVFKGTGTLNGATARARAVFARGNPQVTFEYQIQGVVVAMLGESEPRWELPVGDVRFLDDKLQNTPFVGGDQTVDLDAWTPGWVRWTGQGRTLQFSQWHADQTTLTEADGKTTVTLSMFKPERRGWPDCPELAEVKRDLDLRFMVTVGSTPYAVPSRFPKGYRAMVAPVFDDPRSHGNGVFAKSGTEDPERFERRARTLAMGHSQPTDPRHGNGGLAPAHLGGTLVWDGEPDPTIEKLQKELGAGTEIATLWPESAGKTRPMTGDCATDVATITGGEAVIGQGGDYDGAFANAIVAHTAPAFDDDQAAVFRPAMLSGTRAQLLEQAISPMYLDRLEAERGLFVFATPLIASRNPLVGAAAEALLQPERDGQWTLVPSVAKALAGIELMSESGALGFASLGSIKQHWADARRATLVWTEDGQLEVHAFQPVPTFSVVVEGAHTPASGALKTHAILDRGKSPQTWTTVDASDGQVTIGLTLEPDQRLRPVEWSLSR